MESLSLISGPSVEPLGLDDARAFLRLDGHDEDALVSSLCTAARQWAERHTKRGFIDQVWRLTLDGNMPFLGGAWPSDRALDLLGAPLISVSQVVSYDQDGNAHVWDPGDYALDVTGTSGRLLLKDGNSWLVGGRRFASLAVDYHVGYGTSASDVPEAIRMALSQIVAAWFQTRGALSGAIPESALAILAPYRLWTVHG